VGLFYFVSHAIKVKENGGALGVLGKKSEKMLGYMENFSYIYYVND